jgi:hypothetical protein
VADEALIARALRGQEPSQEAGVPRPVAKPAAAVFRMLSRLRSARSFHPDGVVFEATVDVDRPPPELSGVPLLGQRGSHQAVVRLSRALGLPRPVPDVHGFAIRFVDAHGSGRHQDFLTVTSLDGPFAHHILLPTGGFFSLPFSSLLPLRLGSRIRLVGARPVTEAVRGEGSLGQLLETAQRRPVRFELTLATLLGRWTAIGIVSLGDRVPQPDAERIRFNPWNTGGGIEPTGPFNGLRESAYRESQRGWSADMRHSASRPGRRRWASSRYFR